MRRPTTNFLMTAFALLTGLSANWCGPASPIAEADKPLHTSLCELDRDPLRYDGKLIRVKATLHGDLAGSAYLVDQSCGSASEPLAKMIGIIPDTNAAISAVPEWATYVAFCANDPYLAMFKDLSAEVILVGVFDSSQRQVIPRTVVQLTPASKKT